MSNVIQSLDRGNISTVTSEMTNLLQRELGDRFGLDISYEGATFTASQATVRISLVVRKNEEGISGAQASFEMYARFYGLKASDYHKTFVNPFDHRTYRIEGFRARAKRYPILARCIETGKEVAFTVGQVREALKSSLSE